MHFETDRCLQASCDMRIAIFADRTNDGAVDMRRSFWHYLVPCLLSCAVAFSNCRVTRADEPPTHGVIVLDNCDPLYHSRNTPYFDNLTFLSASGKVRKRVSGLNVCEEIGNPHRIAVDPKRNRVWLAETVGHRLIQYDLSGSFVRAVNGAITRDCDGPGHGISLGGAK